jgi:recombination protein RecA
VTHTSSHTLQATVARIHARFGPRALTRGRGGLGRSNFASLAIGRSAVPHISTGYPELDALLEIGGLPKGKVCEIVGQQTSGKTTLAFKFLAQAQAHGPVAYVDPACVFDADYAHRCGIDLSNLMVGRSHNLTECLVVAEALVQSESLAALVIDASAWLASDTFVAFLRRLSVPLAHSGLVLLFVHEVQGVRRVGHALTHYATLRLGIRRVQWLRQHGDVRGYRSRIEVLKNRMGPTGRAATITIDADLWSVAPGP